MDANLSWQQTKPRSEFLSMNLYTDPKLHSGPNT